MPDSVWFIKNCDIFSHVAEEDVRWLEQQSKMRKLKKGEPVYLPSQEADGVLLVAKGRVKICHITPDGKQSILSFIDPGEIFGELALIDCDKRDEYAEASEATNLIMMPKMALRQIVQRYPNIVMGVTKLIGARRQRVERRLRNLLFRSNRERVIHLLLELSEKYGQLAPEGLDLNIRLSHQEMASVIGSTRETVTVVLGQLQNEGLIKIARRRISIRNLKQLASDVNERVPTIRSQSNGQHLQQPTRHSFAGN